MWVLVALGVAVALGLGGCVACAGIIAVSTEQEQRAQRRHTVTDARARALRLGTPRPAVLARFGSSAGPYDGAREQAGRDCLFYNLRGSDVGSQWQLCFVRGRLAAKYRWT